MIQLKANTTYYIMNCLTHQILYVQIGSVFFSFLFFFRTHTEREREREREREGGGGVPVRSLVEILTDETF